jgi:hypothetical protein
MQLDLDAILSNVLPWDFTVKLGGKVYQTRPPTVAEAVQLDKAFRANNGDQIRVAVASIFGGTASGAPDFDQHAPGAASAVAHGLIEYWKEHIRKNSQAIAPAVKAAMEKLIASSSVPATSGQSSAA